MWITNGSIANVAIVWAKLAGEGDGPDAIRGFLVEIARHLRDRHPRQVVHASIHHQQRRAQRCPHPGGEYASGRHQPESRADVPEPGALRHRMGRHRRRHGCYDTALQYTKLRKQFHGEPIASHQLVQDKLVWMATEIAKAQLLSLHVGRLKDAEKAGHQHISMAKRNNVWMALETARIARDLLGANGVTEDFPIMRHMMNLESVKTYEGTQDIHTLILGQHLTGIAAY